MMKAPFPWFGGKSRVADLVWSRFGDVPNYVEPFAGSLAVLLGRPTPPRTETVNDLDCYISNFWRCINVYPEETAKWADWPVNEADLTARHQWLVDNAAFREAMKADCDYCDPKVAGWWVWGICQWIGSGWCADRSSGQGVHRQLPHLGDAGQGEAINIYFNALSERLRYVRVACGQWSRVLGDSVTVKHGLTGVFLDPPYSAEAGRDNNLYRHESGIIAHDVRKWAIDNGDNPLLRIALCGYEGEHEPPDSWECVQWKSRGGYGSQASHRGRENSHRERIWFSPHCLKQNMGLFGGDK